MKGEVESKRKAKGDEIVREMCVRPIDHQNPQLSLYRPQVSSSLFFQYNQALVPPYSVLVDTNFLSHTVQHKLEMLSTMMDCLYAECYPVITGKAHYLSPHKISLANKTRLCDG